MAAVKRITSPGEANRETATDVEILYSDQAIVRAKLTAPLMIHHEVKEPFTEMPDGLQINFLDEKGKTESTLTAGYGIVYDKSDEMIARNNVVIVNPRNETLNTEEIIWNQKTQKIYSSRFVKIKTEEEILFGDGFESNQDLSDYTIKKIKGTIRLKE
jgi:LPS export ABC transporter protein LptC